MAISGNTVNWLETYYVYDDYGRLKYQVPPKAVAILDGTPNLEADTDLAELIYKYTYDSRGRLVEKKEPGAVAKYMVYDIFDRLVLTQDGTLGGLNKWAFVKYDIYGRSVYTGLYTNSRSRTSVQKWVDKAYTASSSSYPEANYSEYKLSGVDSLHGYSNISFPKDSIFRLAISYYDNYDFNATGTPPFTYDNSHITGLPQTASANVRGMATGSKVRLLSVTGNVTATWIKGVVYYDSYDRVIQTQSNNHLDLSAVDKSSVLYNNIRRVEKTKLTHTAQSVTTHITQRNDYDHAGRVLKTYHQVNSNTEVLAAQYEYNALGQLVDKKLHNTGGSNFLQSVDYRYNIRGWLQSINNAQLSNDTGATNDDTGDYFGMELAYNTAAGMSNGYLYNGNISAVKWKTMGEASGTAGQRSYTYSYDKSDKLKDATFKAYGASAWDKESNTLNESMTYDHGGNIVSLTRKKNARGLSGTSITSSASTIDDLSYTYSSNTNRISKVEDASTSEGFTNGAVNGSSEYTYTNDGSTNKDENKGISSITYNFLGKPQTVNYTDGRKVEYVYDAAGTKLTAKIWNGATLTSATNYSGGFIYDGGTPALSQFSSPEGRVVKNGSNFEYQYALADHQGNTRVVFTSASSSAVVATATFEGDSGDGQAQFSSVTSGKIGPFTAANHTLGGSKIYQMNQSNPLGPTKSTKVYPGDSVKVEVYAYYEANSGYGTNSVSLATAIATALYAANGGIGESTPMTNGVNSALAGFGVGGNAGDGAPAAYLNYILFDQQFKVLDAGYMRVPTSAWYAQQKLSFARYITEAGYYYTYLSYEDQSDNIVYFDDYQVRHVKSRLVQANEYYPFGLQTANSWTRESNVANNFLYNGGRELNQTTQVYDLYYRNYDPVLGRFGQVDPMAGKYGAVSPYHFAGNNPARFNDPRGDDYFDNQALDHWYKVGVYRNFGGPHDTGDPNRVFRDYDPYGTNTGRRMYANALEALTLMRGAQDSEITVADGIHTLIFGENGTVNYSYTSDEEFLALLGGRELSEVRQMFAGAPIISNYEGGPRLWEDSGLDGGFAQIRNGIAYFANTDTPYYRTTLANGESNNISATLVIPLVLEGISTTAVAGLAMIAAIPLVLSGDAADTKYQKSKYTTLYRGVTQQEYESYMRKGMNFGFGPNSLDVKQFWMTPEGLANWQSSNMTRPYVITVGIPTSIIGPVVHVQTLDGHMAGVVYPNAINAFNAAKVTISINKVCN